MTAKQTDLTREKLLNAAFCEIHRHGFQAASIANILQNTGLTKGALYHHFATKRELGFAVVDEVIGPRLDALVFAKLRESKTPVRTLLQIIGDKMGKTDADTVVLGCPLNNLMQEMSPLDEDFKARLNAILTTWGSAVEDALARGQMAGEIRPDVDCRAAALFIVSAWEGCVGIAKSLQSAEGFALCMKQLQDYVRGLTI
jgi:TetR/AcrR family transcriptional regulator, transcriptional repressor for nem operon